MVWQLQEAKNQLSAVVNRALAEGPQTITRHGKPAVVVVACDDYARTDGREKLSAILRECPVRGWVAARTKEPGRTIKLG